MACYVLIMVLHLFCAVSLDQCTFILSSLRLVLKLASATSSEVESQRLSWSLPKDVRTLLKRADLQPETQAYVCCPKCFATYRFDPISPSYPLRCTNREAQRSDACNRLLRKVDSSSSKPVRLFILNDLHAWIAQLYCRPGFEEFLDRDPPPDTPDTDEVHDIWEAPIVREFLGPDGKLFMDRPGNESRLMFSLNMDGFNPFFNKEAGKKVSTCAIYLVCLNLPPSLRYKIENMFLVGIIPGPNEPSQHQINHLLRPLVDVLLKLWYRGLYLSATVAHPRGRLVRGAVVPLVCDLPAIRLMSGFAHHKSHNFCSFCKLQLEDIENFKCDTWEPRTWEEHKIIAKKWLNASSEDKRSEIYDMYGIRWSELIRLPYWDPTRFVIIDSMHAFYLRLFQRHVRDIWGMDVEFADGEGASFAYGNHVATPEEMKAAHQVLRHGTMSELGVLRAHVLKELCRDTQSLRFSGSKKKLLKSLRQYVSRSFISICQLTTSHSSELSEGGSIQMANA